MIIVELLVERWRLVWLENCTIVVYLRNLQGPQVVLAKQSLDELVVLVADQNGPERGINIVTFHLHYRALQKFFVCKLGQIDAKSRLDSLLQIKRHLDVRIAINQLVHYDSFHAKKCQCCSPSPMRAPKSLPRCLFIVISYELQVQPPRLLLHDARALDSSWRLVLDYEQLLSLIKAYDVSLNLLHSAVEVVEVRQGFQRRFTFVDPSLILQGHLFRLREIVFDEKLER